MNIRIIVCLMLVGMAMARKGSTPTNCRNTDCRGLVGTLQSGSLGTTGNIHSGVGGIESANRNGENRKNRKNRKNKKKKNGNFEDELPQNIQHSSSPSLHVESSSNDRESRIINLGSLFGNRPTSTFGGRPTSSTFGSRPTSSIFGGRPTSSVFGGRPIISRPVSSFGHSHSHGSSFGGRPTSSVFGGRPIINRPVSSFGNSHNHGSSFGGSLSIGFGPGLTIGFGPSHGSSFGNSFGSSSSDCRYWCRTPQGQAYCCEDSHQASSGVFGFVKPGQCPPVRPSCPAARSFIPPSQCSSDARCPGSEKCCFDTCLQHHTCKPPQRGFFGR